MSPVRTVLAAVLVAAAALSVTGGDAAASGAPTVYAHRGGAAIAPENTLGAFRQAHALFGADGVWLEMDAVRTSDGELVVIHDATLDRTTNCTGAVITRTLAQVQACDARDTFPNWPTFEGVPALRDVLTEGRDSGWRIMVELKNIPGEPDFDPTGAASAAELVSLIAETAFPLDRLLVQSFFPTSLDQVKAANPAVATAFLTTSQLPGAPAGVGFTAGQNASFSALRGYDVSAPDHRSVDLSAAVVAAAHALGRPVVPWTVDDGDRAAELAGFGVDGIITNDPQAVYDAL